MTLLPQRKFKMKDYTEENLKNMGFRCKKDSQYYIRFPAHKYHDVAVLICEVTVDSLTGDIKLDVYNNSEETWPPFYADTYIGNSEFVEKINCKILARLADKYGIKEAKKNVRKNYFRR